MLLLWSSRSRCSLAFPNPSRPRRSTPPAGPRDHGAPGRHEYERDLKSLAQSLEQASNLKGVSTQLIVGALPRDLAAVRDAAAIVIDSSSDRADNETHPLFPPNPSTNGRGYDPETAAYLKALDDLIKEKKIGVVILHYATWAENWRAREYYLNWTGGWGPDPARRIRRMSGRWPKIANIRSCGQWPWTYRDDFCRFFLPNDKRRTNLLLATPKKTSQASLADRGLNRPVR